MSHFLLATLFTFIWLDASASPLFKNSIVSTDIDFIHSDDFTVTAAIEFTGTGRQEMPDKRHDELFDDSAYTFAMNFNDDVSINIFASSDFENNDAALEYVEKLLGPLGKLPYLMRSTMSHVVIHRGNETASAEKDAQFFVVYSKNMDIRIANNDLEETVFHESVHATLDWPHRFSEDWKAAQKADNEFITEYGRRIPDGEDFAETALFAYTMINHPGRLSNDVEYWMKNRIPSRLEYFTNLFEGIDIKPEPSWVDVLMSKLRKHF